MEVIRLSDFAPSLKGDPTNELLGIIKILHRLFHPSGQEAKKRRERIFTLPFPSIISFLHIPFGQGTEAAKIPHFRLENQPIAIICMN
jgi:hypothetical protein